MRIQHPIFYVLLFLSALIFPAVEINAQRVEGPATYYPSKGANGQVQIVSTIKERGQIMQLILISDPNIDLTRPKDSARPAGSDNSLIDVELPVITVDLPARLPCVLKKEGVEVSKFGEKPCTSTPPDGEAIVLKASQILISYVNTKGKVVSETIDLVLYKEKEVIDSLSEVKADSDEDADYYISGNITGARKKKTAFTTEIRLQPSRKRFFKGSLEFTPVFFTLNASTAADADPDKMEIGTKFRNVFARFAGFQGAYFDYGVKLESERDFENTNLVSDARLLFLPKELGNAKKVKIFLNPFIGAEAGKNLRSPLNAAEGDGIARILGGADLRVAFLRANGRPWGNWTSSYTRRWLLSNELSFRTDNNDNLVLVQFGKRPRDYFESKFSFGIGNFMDAFIAYDWGETPPSYKKMDHRFRIGFEFKKKTVPE